MSFSSLLELYSTSDFAVKTKFLWKFLPALSRCPKHVPDGRKDAGHPHPFGVRLHILRAKCDIKQLRSSAGYAYSRTSKKIVCPIRRWMPARAMGLKSASRPGRQQAAGAARNTASRPRIELYSTLRFP
jgi:hypothetical protein